MSHHITEHHTRQGLAKILGFAAFSRLSVFFRNLYISFTPIAGQRLFFHLFFRDAMWCEVAASDPVQVSEVSQLNFL